MTYLNREKFEAWLFAQPKNRPFNYVAGCYYSVPPRCPVCEFLHENFKGYFFVSPMSFASKDGTIRENFEPWLYKLLSKVRTTEKALASEEPSRFTAGDLQDEYLKLYPDTKEFCQIINPSGEQRKENTCHQSTT